VVESAGPSGNVLGRNLRARARVLVCTAIGAAAWLAMPWEWRESTRVLTGWNLGAGLYILSTLLLVPGKSQDEIRQHALDADEGRFVALTFSCLAATAALVAIVAQLGAVKDAKGIYYATHLALAGVTVATSWSFMHLIFAQHYAHEFFIERDAEMAVPEEFRGGLVFPGTREPTFSDFLYFAFIIGVASQTADVEISTSTMRRISLAHSLLSFVFNTAILALTINVASGLISS
jgi:uncharacterized membrane protein